MIFFRYLKKHLSKDEKHELLTLLVENLYNITGKDDILKEDKGDWYFKNKKMSPEMKKSIISQAKNFYKCTLWKILENDIEYMANKKMYLKSMSEDDLIQGKLWLYTLDCFNQRMENMIKAGNDLEDKSKSKK